MGPASTMRVRMAALAVGVFSQVAQVLVFREVMAATRASELVFGLVLAGSLLWTGAGAALGGRLERGGRVLRFASASSGLALAAELALVRMLGPWGAGGAGEALSFGRASALAVFAPLPAGILAGAAFSAVLAVSAGERRDASRPAEGAASFAVVYRWESIGAVLAGLALTGLFAVAGGLFGTVRAALLVGLAPALAAGGASSRGGLFAAAPAVLSAALALAPFDAFLESARWSWALPGYKLVSSRDSPHGRIAALESPLGAQLAIFENGAPVACVEPGSEADDTRFLADLVACLHPRPRRACVVGGTLAAFVPRLAEHGLERVDAVELDPALAALASLAGARDPPVVRRLVEDGRALLARAPAGSYEIVTVFPGEPDSSISSRFCSVEFFRAASRALSQGGVMALFLPAYGSGLEYHGEALARRSGAVFAAMREVFEEVRAAPVAGHMLVGCKSTGVIALSPGALSERLASRERRPAEIATILGGRLELARVYFSALFGGALAESELPGEGPRQELVLRLERALEESGAQASRDERPTVVMESLALGGELRGGYALLRAMRWLRFVAAALPAALLVGLGVASFLRGRHAGTPRTDRAARLLAAFATGMFGMAFETALLWSYQAARGCVYSELGGIVASFMAGLGLGAALGERVAPGWEARALLAIVATMAAASAFLAPLFRVAAMFAPLYWFLAAAAGALDGATFPLLVGRPEGAPAGDPSGLGDGTARTGSRVYAADLAGSALGAALAGAIWMPTLGLAGAGAATAAALAAAGVFVFLAGAPRSVRARSQ